MAYVHKVRPHLSEMVQKDQRPRSDKAGGDTNQAPKTWEEAHELDLEYESTKRNVKSVKDNATMVDVGDIGEAPTCWQMMKGSCAKGRECM